MLDTFQIREDSGVENEAKMSNVGEDYGLRTERVLGWHASGSELKINECFSLLILQPDKHSLHYE